MTVRECYGICGVVETVFLLLTNTQWMLHTINYSTLTAS